MSRWSDAAAAHPYRVTWVNLLEIIDSQVVDDETVSTTVEELARLKKVIVYINGIINNLDYELVPLSIFNNFHQQAQACLQEVRNYQSNRNVGHLSNANSHADNLLTYVRPYMVLPEKSLEVYGASIKAFKEKVSEYIKSFEASAKKSQLAIASAVGDAQSKKKAIEAVELRVKSFDKYLFEGGDENISAEKKIKDTVDAAENDYQAINKYKSAILDGDKSVSEEIRKFKESIEGVNEEIISLREASINEHEDLKAFHELIFGVSSDDETGNKVRGLKQELDQRKEQLDKYEVDQKTKHKAILEEVESLLHGATSAALATSYNNLKNSFNRPILIYSIVFYVLIFLMFICGVITVTDYFSLKPFVWTMVPVKDINEILKTLILRVPIIVPVVWLAIFSATRRSQYERLQQEYAHKESLASSYLSYKKQLNSLGVDGDELTKELMGKSIESLAFNASKTLDGKHMESPPFAKVIENINADEMKKVLDLLKIIKSS